MKLSDFKKRDIKNLNLQTFKELMLTSKNRSERQIILKVSEKALTDTEKDNFRLFCINYLEIEIAITKLSIIYSKPTYFYPKKRDWREYYKNRKNAIQAGLNE